MFERAKKRIKDRLGVPSHSWSFNNAKRNGFNPAVIYDIGAYTGTWTTEVMEYFPRAKYFLFEGQPSKEVYLQALKNKFPGSVNYEIGLLGAKDGEKVVFNEYETASSVLTEHFDTGATRHERTINSMDTVAKNKNWPAPDLIKLDTQGYELEILKGASFSMQKAEAVLMEVSFIDIYINAPLAKDVIDFMLQRDFVLYDICSLMRRPLDKALFQADFLFVKSGSPLLTSKKWG